MCTYTRFLPNLQNLSNKELFSNTPIPTFICPSTLNFPINRESLLPVLFFVLFKIDHDNDTVNHILSHLVAKQEQSNNQNLTDRYIGRHCIDNQCVFDLFTIVFLLVGACNSSRNSQKQILYESVHQKVPNCHRKRPHILFLNSILHKECNAPTPVFYNNIDY